MNQSIGSNCCNADMCIRGDNTKYYECRSCGNPCDMKVTVTMAVKPGMSVKEKYEKLHNYVDRIACIDKYGEVDGLSRSWIELAKEIMKEIGEHD